MNRSAAGERGFGRPPNAAARRRSECSMRAILCRLVCLTLAAAPPAWARAAGAGGPGPSVAVTAGPAGRGAVVRATLGIHARPAVVWHLLTSCGAAVHIVPGLRECEVERSAADRSWQLIRQVVAVSWYLPRLRYVVRVTYRPPGRITFEQTAGDLDVLRGSWLLRPDGDSTRAQYALEVVPRFWVPGWLVRRALERDLPRMLATLRARAERAPPGAVAGPAGGG
jgi:Polyketide cyclase / dehydrase and lipid transport